MSINSNTINDETLNGDFDAAGSGTLISIDQQVAFIGSGVLINIEQEINLRVSGSGILLNMDQQVVSLGSGALINICQQVLSTQEQRFFTGNGWDAVVTLGGLSVPRSQIQNIEVTHSVGDNARATVTLNPGSATYNLYSYQGKQLTISARTGTEYKRLFTGIVDIPRVELINEKIILEGISNRETLIRNNLTPYVPTIGYYSSAIFGDPRNVFQETNDRLTTIPFDLDFDGNNNWTLTSWTPKGTADFTLGNNNLYREQQPTVRIESSRDVVNKVVIDATYVYQRLHQLSINYSWSAAGLDVCEFLTKGNTLPSRSMIQEAAKSAGWAVYNMGFTELWSGGFYRCNGVSIGWVNNKQSVVVSSTGALDSRGNVYTASSTTGLSSLNSVLARGAAWAAKTRVAQNVRENYTITVQSPQSQTLYGVRENNQKIDIQSEFDVSQWENERNYNSEFSGTKRKSSDANTYYINSDLNNTDLNKAMIVALNQAKTTILKSHRDTEVMYTTFINPNLALRHTVALNTSRIVTKGKVKTIKHMLNAEGEATTEVTLLLYRGVGSQVETTLSPPARPTFVNPSPLTSISLNSRWGQDPSTVGARKWTGYIGNKWITAFTGGAGRFGFNTDTYMTTFQESFVVDVPQVPTDRRQDVVYAVTQSYNVQIPTDNLSVIFIDS